MQPQSRITESWTIIGLGSDLKIYASEFRVAIRFFYYSLHSITRHSTTFQMDFFFGPLANKITHHSAQFKKRTSIPRKCHIGGQDLLSPPVCRKRKINRNKLCTPVVVVAAVVIFVLRLSSFRNEPRPTHFSTQFLHLVPAGISCNLKRIIPVLSCVFRSSSSAKHTYIFFRSSSGRFSSVTELLNSSAFDAFFLHSPSEA